MIVCVSVKYAKIREAHSGLGLVLLETKQHTEQQTSVSYYSLIL